MTLTKQQVRMVRKYLSDNGIESRLVFDDLLDHVCCMIENTMDSDKSFSESLSIVAQGLTGCELKRTELFTLKLLNMETSFSTKTSLLATIPFGLFGLAWIIDSSGVSAPLFILNFTLIASVLSMFVLLGIGWVKGFPRWSFPAIGFCLLFSIVFMYVTVPAISRELLGLWAWLPFLLTMIISLSFRFSWAPLKELGKKVKDDPGLLLFGLYGFAPAFMFAVTDEIHTPLFFFVSLSSILILGLGIYLYLKSSKKIVRFSSIVLAAVLAFGITLVSSLHYWG